MVLKVSLVAQPIRGLEIGDRQTHILKYASRPVLSPRALDKNLRSYQAHFAFKTWFPSTNFIKTKYALNNFKATLNRKYNTMTFSFENIILTNLRIKYENITVASGGGDKSN